jgi:hypothetical protein
MLLSQDFNLQLALESDAVLKRYEVPRFISAPQVSTRCGVVLITTNINARAVLSQASWAHQSLALDKRRWIAKPRGTPSASRIASARSKYAFYRCHRLAAMHAGDHRHMLSVKFLFPSFLFFCRCQSSRGPPVTRFCIGLDTSSLFIRGGLTYLLQRTPSRQFRLCYYKYHRCG